MKESGIYIIRNKTNNKLYIGSAINYKKRKREHLSNLKNNTHHSKYLQNAWNKYGESNFDFYLILLCSPKNLISTEQLFLDIFKPSYNMSPTARNVLGIKRSEETKKKLSESHKGQIPWNKGIPATEIQKENQRQKMVGRVSGAKGKKWSLESRKKASKAKKGRKPNNCIAVEQYDMMGNFIKEFESVKQAEIETNSKGIYHVLSGKYKHCNNYIWKKKIK